MDKKWGRGRKPFRIRKKKFHRGREIEGYGFHYDRKAMIMATVILLMASAGLAYVFMLKKIEFLIVAVCACLSLPIIIRAQFRFSHNNERFENLVNYMDRLILSFKQNPKIISALNDAEKVTDGEMARAVEDAVRVIENDATVSGAEVYPKAFGIIQGEFPSARLRTLQSYLMQVERENSRTYLRGLDDLRIDIRGWVTRTYKYMAELQNIKRKVVMIMGISVGVAAIFARVLARVETIMKGTAEIVLTGGRIYQISTMIFLILFIGIYTLMSTKINGSWLTNDLDQERDRTILRDLDYVLDHDPKKAAKRSLTGALICSVLIPAGILISSRPVIFLGIGMMLLAWMMPGMTYRKKKKKVERQLAIDFPVWLRDVAANMNNLVAVRAMEASYEYTTPLMRRFLDRFFDRLQADPTAFEPYDGFFGEFHVAELTTAMRSLYSVRVLGPEEAQRELNDLVQRNQELIAESERMRNEDMLAGAGFLSMLPMLLLSVKLLVDLVIMLTAFLGLTGSMPGIGG